MTEILRIVPFSGISFETAVTELWGDNGFACIDTRSAPPPGNRYSIIVSNPRHTFAFAGGFTCLDNHTVIESPSDGFRRFADLLGQFGEDTYLPATTAIGYIGFEGAKALRGFEPAKGFSRHPQCMFGIYPSAIVFDNIEGSSWIQFYEDDAAERLLKRLQQVLPLCKGELVGVDQSTSPTPPLQREENFLKAPLKTLIPAASGKKQTLETDSPAKSLLFSPGGGNISRFLEVPLSDCRSSPDEAEFKRLLSHAHMWLRSEKLTRIRLARHIWSAPVVPIPINSFLLDPAETGLVRAVFLHNGSYFAFKSGDSLLEIDNGHAYSNLAANCHQELHKERASELAAVCENNPQVSSQDTLYGKLRDGLKPIDGLINMLPVSTITGFPVNRAVGFINQHEEYHRSFYGGAFGTLTPERLSFRTIEQSTVFGDESIMQTVGLEVDATM